ncbi:MAG: hypothetical protein IID43_04660, partial [Planctomycetes bacterium]|nr:hypothetical protein [Planctomycetota bacterium]
MRTHTSIALSLFAVVVTGCASSGQADRGTFAQMETLSSPRSRADRKLRGEHFDEAVRSYLALLEKPSGDLVDDATIRHLLSRAYWGRAGRIDATDATAKTRAADRTSAVEYAHGAWQQLQSQRDDTTTELYGRVGRTLGRYLRSVGEMDEAISVYQTLLERTVADGASRVQALCDLGNAHLDRSRRYVDQRSAGSDSPGDLFMALRYLEDARELAGRTEDCPPLLLANVNNALGLIHNVQLQFTVAVERVSQAER